MRLNRFAMTGKNIWKSAVLGLMLAAGVSMAGYAGTWVPTETGWTLVDAAGNRLTGWQENDGAWYYLDEAGNMKTGWIELNGTWYYLQDSGAMATGWQEIGGKYYYLDSSGAMKTAHHTSDDVTYSFRADGSLSEVKKKKNTGGGSFPVEFYSEAAQQLADTLNETKLDLDELAEDKKSDDGDDEDDEDEEEDEKPRRGLFGRRRKSRDEDEDDEDDEDSKKDRDKNKSYVIDGGLQAAAEHRLALAVTRGYGNGKIPDEGYVSDYYKSIGSNYSNRRNLEIFLPLCTNASEAEEKLDARYGEDNRKRQNRLSYYTKIGIACREYNGKYQYMIELMR